MKRFPTVLVLLIVLASVMATDILYAQSAGARKLFDQKNLIAWCIVPFDSKNRNPEERVEMLRRLKFSQYAYDWRHQHLDSFASEIKIAKEKKVRIAAVWLWIDRNADKVGKLSDDNLRVLDIIKSSGLQTDLWVGFNHNFFDDMDEAAKVSAGVEMVRYLRELTGSFVKNIGLYNHGDWFGDPVNQVKIVQSISDPGVRIVYNFHHGHAQVNDFPALVKAMKPYLMAVNVNGMKKDGPQILPVGSGDEEKEMLRTLLQSGYSGPIGLLGHIETEDVEVVLRGNLDGLKKLTGQL